jgi:hypothetical protein
VDDYAGRVLADRYRLPRPPSDAYDLVETRAFDTYSGQQVLVRQIPLPEVVDAEVVGADGRYGTTVRGGPDAPAAARRTARRDGDPAVRRAVDAATAAAALPDHPRLDQVFDVFAEGGSLWIVSELVAGRPLAALLAERPMSPHRAAEVAADILTALRALHAHGWTHRNITARTVLLCEDGRAMLTGLAAGAAEEALCGYDPVPRPPGRLRTRHRPAPGGRRRAPRRSRGAGRPGRRRAGRRCAARRARRPQRTRMARRTRRPHRTRRGRDRGGPARRRRTGSRPTVRCERRTRPRRCARWRPSGPARARRRRPGTGRAGRGHRRLPSGSAGGRTRRRGSRFWSARAPPGHRCRPLGRRSRREWDRARPEWDRACRERDRARGERDRARGEWDRACGEWDRARPEWDRARGERRAVRPTGRTGAAERVPRPARRPG